LVPGGDSHVPTRNPSLSVLAARRVMSGQPDRCTENITHDIERDRSQIHVRPPDNCGRLNARIFVFEDQQVLIELSKTL